MERKAQKHEAIRTVTLPDGSISNQVWLCTSPIHYRNILMGVMLGNKSSHEAFNGQRLSEVAGDIEVFATR